MMRRQQGPAARWPIALVISLALHAAVALPIFRWVTTPMSPAETARPVPPSSAGPLDPCAPLRLSVQRERDARFGPDAGRHRVDVFHPAGGQRGGPWPALLLFTDDAPDGDGADGLRRIPPLARRLATRGYVVAVVQATPPTGAALTPREGKLALRWLKAQAGRLELRPDAVGVVGGRLAALVGLGHGPRLGDTLPAWLDDGARPAALALAAVPGDPAARPMDAMLSGCATPEPCPDCDAPLCVDCAVDPVRYADADDPPTLIIAGRADCVVPERHARRLAEALQEAGVAAQWDLVPGVVRADDLIRTPTRMAELETFFDAELRGCRPLPTPVPLLTDEDVDRLLAASRPAPPPPKKTPEKEEEEKKPSERPDRQVVEIPPPKNRERPEDARFLSEYDSKVDKEQVSRNNQAPTPRVVKSELRKIGKGDERSGTSPKKPVVRPKKTRKTRKAIAPTPGDAPTAGETPSPTPAPKPIAKADRKADPAAELAPGEGPFAAEQPAAPNIEQPAGGGTPGGATAPDDWRKLLPSLGPEEIARQDGSIDHIDDMNKGEGTFLNTAEYKHAWFFNRVKRSVQQRWRAVDAHRRNDPYGRIYGVRDRMTVLQVTLNPDGTLDDLFVTKDSGVAFLDDAALRAFRDAQPFPNPPDALRGSDGRIRFKFSFFLEINGRGMRMFRSR